MTYFIIVIRYSWHIFLTATSWITTKPIFTRVSRRRVRLRCVSFTDDDRVSHTGNNNNICGVYICIMRRAVRSRSVLYAFSRFTACTDIMYVLTISSLLHASRGHSARWQPPSFRKYKYNLHYLGRVIRTCQCECSGAGYRWPCGVAWRLIRRVPIWIYQVYIMLRKCFWAVLKRRNGWRGRGVGIYCNTTILCTFFFYFRSLALMYL